MRVHLRAMIGLIGLISFGFMINQEVMQQLASHLCARSVVRCHGNRLFPACPSLFSFFFYISSQLRLVLCSHPSFNDSLALARSASFIYFLSFFASAKCSFCRLRSNSTRCLYLRGCAHKCSPSSSSSSRPYRKTLSSGKTPSSLCCNRLCVTFGTQQVINDPRASRTRLNFAVFEL